MEVMSNIMTYAIAATQTEESSLSKITTTALLVILGVLTLAFVVVFIQDLIKHKDEMIKESHAIKNFIVTSIIGFVVNFFDTLGIGSFAPSTALLRVTKTTEDRLIPGTLNVACCIPVVAEAFLFISGVKVEPITLAAMLIAATAGAYLGAGIVSKLPTKSIQFVMGCALAVTGIIVVCQLTGVLPTSLESAETGLTGVKLVIGVVANFVLGALMTAGIGLYAPCMALVIFLGMSVDVAFPIMMGSCAYLMPVASIKFVKEGAYNRTACLAFSIFGVVGVYVAYLFFSGLLKNTFNIAGNEVTGKTILLWIVVAVMVYTSTSLFMAAKKKESK